jgi:hypothetical protein
VLSLIIGHIPVWKYLKLILAAHETLNIVQEDVNVALRWMKEKIKKGESPLDVTDIYFKQKVQTEPNYQLYTGSGICDVCNRSLNGVTAYIVPNNVFYSSQKWRNHYKRFVAQMSGMTPTDADIEQMRRMDKSHGSAVCENCIHMFG